MTTLTESHLDNESLKTFLELESRRQEILSVVNAGDLIDKLRELVDETPHMDFKDLRARKHISNSKIMLKLKYREDLYSVVKKTNDEVHTYVEDNITKPFTAWLNEKIEGNVDVAEMLKNVRESDIKVYNFVCGTVFGIAIDLTRRIVNVTYIR